MKKQIKPIFVVRYPFHTPTEIIESNLKSTTEMMKDDYYILFTRDHHTGENIKFECYNSDCTEIEIKELQDKILNLIKEV